MTVPQCVEQLLEVEERRRQGGARARLPAAGRGGPDTGARAAVYAPRTVCVGVARVGADDQRIVAGTLSELLSVDLGPPLHSLVMAGRMHVVEAEYLKQFAVRPASIDEYMADQQAA